MENLINAINNVQNAVNSFKGTKQEHILLEESMKIIKSNLSSEAKESLQIKEIKKEIVEDENKITEKTK